MRVVLADLKSDRGFVSKDTVVGGYGSRLQPFSKVTKFVARAKARYHDVPSVHMAYAAAILTRAGHDVAWSRGAEVDGDVALVLRKPDLPAAGDWSVAIRDGKPPPAGKAGATAK